MSFYDNFKYVLKHIFIMPKEDSFDFEKEYNEFKKKYKLPDFEKLNNEFELSSYKDIDPKFLLRNIRRKLIDKIGSSLRFLENIIHPLGSSVITMNEVKYFDETNLNKVNNLIKKLMLLERQSLVLDLELNEAADAEFIDSFFKEWTDIKGELKEVTIIVRDSWKEEEKTDTEDYFG